MVAVQAAGTRSRPRLTKQANEHPAPFMALLGKVLPQQVDASISRVDLSKYTDDELDLLESLFREGRAC